MAVKSFIRGDFRSLIIDNAIRTDRVNSYVGEFIILENYTRIRVGFKTSNQQSAMSYKMEKS